MWQRGNRGRGRGRNQGPWPGQGPFSHLPPWQRPGWLYGPGSCWWLYQQPPSSTSDQQPPRLTSDQQESWFPPGIDFCENCNASLLPNANYCAHCGAPVKKKTR